MPRYAESTSVPADRSRAEIERTLERYGADGFMYGWEDRGRRAVIAFRAAGRNIRFELEMPDPDDREFSETPTGRSRSEKAARTAWEQACRQRWRALALVVKAKLEAVSAGISVFDEEFMPWIVLPDGSTVGDQVLPRIEEAYLSGKMPKLLSAPGGGSK